MKKFLNIVMISILAPFLVGVSRCNHISYYDNEPYSRPIVSKSQERRICAELCMAGLGGEPCGESCMDVIPQGLPVEGQSGANRSQVDLTRRDACPLLCANRLGYPLCGCEYSAPSAPFFRVDFVQICAHFCESHDYRVYGCDECQSYTNMSARESIVGVSGAAPKASYDWNAWCVQMCQEGDGGSACYCDLLPFSLKIK